MTQDKPQNMILLSSIIDMKFNGGVLKVRDLTFYYTPGINHMISFLAPFQRIGLECYQLVPIVEIIHPINSLEESFL